MPKIISHYHILNYFSFYLFGITTLRNYIKKFPYFLYSSLSSVFIIFLKGDLLKIYQECYRIFIVSVEFLKAGC